MCFNDQSSVQINLRECGVAAITSFSIQVFNRTVILRSYCDITEIVCIDLHTM